jgi:hypothetical protein
MSFRIDKSLVESLELYLLISPGCLSEGPLLGIGILVSDVMELCLMNGFLKASCDELSVFGETTGKIYWPVLFAFCRFRVYN